MQPLAAATPGWGAGLRGVFCDIDDTLTWEGQLVPEAFSALHQLRRAGLRVVPITGRPAGWVDHIARMWPVDGVVGENGGLWFYHREGKLHRRFIQSPSERIANRARLEELSKSILAGVPGTALASDQPYRELDLAIDFCEDVTPLDDGAIDAIVDHFETAGAQCKVSSIHVNGWYGDFDKLEGCQRLSAELWDEPIEEVLEHYVFVGDSANDEPLFKTFRHSIGVANVTNFLPRMSHHPRWITRESGGMGFAEAMESLLEAHGLTEDEATPSPP